MDEYSNTRDYRTTDIELCNTMEPLVRWSLSSIMKKINEYQCATLTNLENKLFGSSLFQAHMSVTSTVGQLSLLEFFYLDVER